MTSATLARVAFVLVLAALAGLPQLRAQPPAPIRYAVPTALHDGIPTGTLAAVGLDSARIIAGTEAILAGTYPGIRSLLVFRRGILAHEQYFAWDGPAPETDAAGRDVLQDLRSVTKTVVGLAVLMAHAQGHIASLDQPVLPFFPEFAASASNGTSRLTVRHLLSMTAGLEWNETVSYLDPANSEGRMMRAPNPIEFVLSRQLVATPGSTFAYCGGCSHLLAEIVHRSTGMPVDQFAARHLFAPLGIETFRWDKGSDGMPYGFSGLRLRSRDVGKIGLLLHQNGEWRGRRLIPGSLVSDAVAEHVVVTPENAEGDIVGYGYQVWRFSFVENGRREQLIQMSGNGGQSVFIHGDADLVVVITAGNFDRTIPKSSLDFYFDHILPAVGPRR
ncbi:MAG: serine hydrolase domain-containing protein [Gemmatimonadales bacterium]